MMDDIADNNVLELRQIVTDSLDIPAPPDDTSDYTSENTEPPQQKEAQIWTYFGAVGGAGVTSLAVQAAWELSCPDMNGPGRHGIKTVLVDLDFECGDCAAYLDTRPSISIDELNASEGRMDADLAASFITKINPGLSLICIKPELGGSDLVVPGALLSLLDNINGLFDIVILDVPAMWRPWTKAVIGAADKFALITEARIPALHQTKKLSVDITKALELANPPEIIINKFERRSLRGGLNLSEAQKVLGNVQCSQICVDDETLRTAINTGQPAGAVKSSSRYVKSVRSHVQAWYSAAHDVNPQFNKHARKPNRRAARR